MSNAIGSIRKSRRSKTVVSGAGCSQLSSNAMTERCAACLELLLAYVETGNDWVELKTRSALGPAQSTSAQLQCARRRKTEARWHFLLHQGPSAAPVLTTSAPPDFAPLTSTDLQIAAC